KRATFWEDVAGQTLTASNLSDGVEQLKRGHVGLTVLVNKYDGIDLPNDACRILVIDGLPEVQGLLERVEQAALSESEVSIRKQIQRIEQGMGRGVRSNEDYCVVILMGGRLTNRIHNLTGFQSFTPATQAQLTLSRKMAEQLQDKPISALVEVVDYCLNRNTSWVSASKGALLDVKPQCGGNVTLVAKNQRQAFDLARTRQFGRSVKLMEEVANQESQPRMRGWLKFQAAEYMHHIDPVEAQKILLSAANINRQVVRPIEGIAYVKLTDSIADQGGTAAKYYRQLYSGPNNLVVGVNSLLEELFFLPETASAFEAVFMKLGFFLGFNAQRPEDDNGKGPDVLWALGRLRYLVIECKNGVVVNSINKHDCNQLGGSLNWFRTIYDSSCTAIPIMVHPVNTFERAASPSSETRILTREKLAKLKLALHEYAIAVAASPTVMADASRIAELLRHFKFNESEFVATYTVPFKVSQ
ncbi:MAG: helicase C-terminal domain-containing protein, partial [Bdellovibrionia bacterium]